MGEKAKLNCRETVLPILAKYSRNKDSLTSPVNTRTLVISSAEGEYYEPIKRVRSVIYNPKLTQIKEINQDPTSVKEVDIDLIHLIEKSFKRYCRNTNSSNWYDQRLKQINRLELIQTNLASNKQDNKLIRLIKTFNYCESDNSVNYLPDKFIIMTLKRRIINNLSILAIPRLVDSLNLEYKEQKDHLCKECYCYLKNNLKTSGNEYHAANTTMLSSECNCECHIDYQDANDLDEEANASIINYSINSQSIKNERISVTNQSLKSEEDADKNLKIRLTVTHTKKNVVEEIDEYDLLNNIQTDKASNKKKKLDRIFEKLAKDDEKKKIQQEAEERKKAKQEAEEKRIAEEKRKQDAEEKRKEDEKRKQEEEYLKQRRLKYEAEEARKNEEILRLEKEKQLRKEQENRLQLEKLRKLKDEEELRKRQRNNNEENKEITPVRNIFHVQETNNPKAKLKDALKHTASAQSMLRKSNVNKINQIQLREETVQDELKGISGSSSNLRRVTKAINK